MKKLIAIALGCTFSAAQAICLNPFGCEPKTLEACRAEAVRMPTERGVTLAVNDCQQKFVYRPAEEKRKNEETRLAKQWSKLISLPTGVLLEQTKKFLGEPVASGDPHACPDDKNNPTQEGCKWHEWPSSKPEASCPSRSLYNWDITQAPIVYRGEFVITTGRLHRWYAESVSTCNNPIQ